MHILIGYILKMVDDTTLSSIIVLEETRIYSSNYDQTF